MAHPWFTGQTGTHAAPSAFPGFRLAPRASASVLACRPGEQGRGRDVGLLVALSWEPKVRQQAWRHDCSPRLGVGCPGGTPRPGLAGRPQPSGESAGHSNLWSASEILNHMAPSLQPSPVDSTLPLPRHHSSAT